MLLFAWPSLEEKVTKTKKLAKSKKHDDADESDSQDSAEICHHSKTTTQGSNGFVRIVKCLACGKVLSRQKILI